MSPDDKSERLTAVETKVERLERDMEKTQEALGSIQKSLEGVIVKLGLIVGLATFLATGATALIVTLVTR